MTKRVDDIVANDLCLGCGLCVSLTPGGTMKETHAGFLAPYFADPAASEAAFETVEACCPGIVLDRQPMGASQRHRVWGAYESCCLGHSTDEELRFRASSGGGISALLCSLLESGEITAAVHVGCTSDNPLRNQVRLSRTREDVLHCAGSRYAPVAALETIKEVLESEERIAFVGKPCDAAALRQLLRLHPQWKPKVHSILAFLCAGQPSYRATDDLLDELDCPREDVQEFWYRGRGWPGMATAVSRQGDKFECSYDDSWGKILGRQIHFRCKLCPDGVGDFADIVCGDAWRDEQGSTSFEDRPGESLLLARNPAGKALLDKASDSGHLQTSPFDLDDLGTVQEYQKDRRLLIGARLLSVRLRGRWVPRYRHFGLLGNMLRSNWIRILKEFWGAWRRAKRPEATPKE